MNLTQRLSFDNIEKYFENLVDHRLQDRYLASSPYPTLSLIAGYLLMVKVILPAYMKNRPAYTLSTVLFYYNLIQVVLSSYLVYISIFASGYGRRYSLFRCRELNQSTTDHDAIMAMNAVYYYYISKFTEFFDTFFFVLRKKDNQISFLHLYHHASMPFNTWMAVKFAPGGSCALGVGINSSIHVVMYTYYFLSSLGPQWQKYLWWKKYLTTFQIIQFLYGLLEIVLIYLTRNECPVFCARYPMIFYAAIYIFSLFILFSRFYVASYRKKQSVEVHKATNGVKNGVQNGGVKKIN